MLCPISRQKLEKKIYADPEMQAFVILSHNIAKIPNFSKNKMFRKLSLLQFHWDIILHNAAKLKKKQHLGAGPGPIFKKIKCLKSRCFVKKSSFWKSLLNLNQKCQNKLLMKRLLDLHLPFLVTQMPFCRTKLPIYWRKEPFIKNIFIQFFHFK